MDHLYIRRDAHIHYVMAIFVCQSHIIADALAPQDNYIPASVMLLRIMGTEVHPIRHDLIMIPISQFDRYRCPGDMWVPDHQEQSGSPEYLHDWYDTHHINFVLNHKNHTTDFKNRRRSGADH